MSNHTPSVAANRQWQNRRSAKPCGGCRGRITEKKQMHRIRKTLLTTLAAIFAFTAPVCAATGDSNLERKRDSLDLSRLEAKETDGNLIRAALKGWHVRLGAGVNIGGTAPLPLPREIRKIKGYSPKFHLALEGDVQKTFENSRWGIVLGVRLEEKGMRTDAEVKNYHMEAVNADGSGTVIGAWTGSVITEVNNTYLSFPIMATFDITPRWRVSAGPYFSYMFNGKFTGEAYDGYIRNVDPTGTKAYVTRATYDFSSSLRRFHWGVQAGADFTAYKHLAVSASLQWGLNGIFPSDFTSVTFPLYPIYATVGFAYLF